MPTKTEQSDLYQALYGRNADSPLVVLAARSPSACFEVAIEAVRLATKYMTPVILLSDGYIANAAEPWRIPELSAYRPFPIHFRTDREGFHPFLRDPATLARPWVKPGTPGMEHRLGGLERNYDSGHAISHIHLRHIWPLPSNLSELLQGFAEVLIPVMNTGQLLTVIRSRYLVP